LPGGVAHDAAQLLIGVIVGAQRIAVRQQHALVIELRDHGVRQELAAAALAEPAAEQEVTVAVQREAGNAARGERAQRAAHALVAGILIIVPDPRLEQVAEDVERFDTRGFGAEKPQELLGRLRRGAIQVHVRDEQSRHRLTLATELCSARAG